MDDVRHGGRDERCYITKSGRCCALGCFLLDNLTRLTAEVIVVCLRQAHVSAGRVYVAKSRELLKQHEMAGRRTLRSRERANLRLFTHLRKEIAALQVGTGLTPEC